jgi:hypothetical protein
MDVKSREQRNFAGKKQENQTFSEIFWKKCYTIDVHLADTGFLRRVLTGNLMVRVKVSAQVIKGNSS